jgi:hypothetical protein
VHIATTSQTHYANYIVTDAIKDIKKGMDRYVTRIRSAEEKGEAPPACDSTRSEE